SFVENGPLLLSAPNVTFVERSLVLVSNRIPKNQSSSTVPRNPRRTRYRSRSRSSQSCVPATPGPGGATGLSSVLPPRYSYRIRASPKSSNSVIAGNNFHFEPPKSGTSFSTYVFPSY